LALAYQPSMEAVRRDMPHFLHALAPVGKESADNRAYLGETEPALTSLQEMLITEG
jgi:hypothetical protein